MVGVAAFAIVELEQVLREHPGLIDTAANELRGSVVVAGVYAGRSVSGEVGVRVVGTLQGIPDLYPDPLFVARVMHSKGIREKADVHCFPDGRACVATPAELRQRFRTVPELPEYIDCVALPFLFALLHFETYGYWPWGERSHGALGLLEGVGTLQDEGRLVNDEVLADVYSQSCVADAVEMARRGASCPCGSGLQFAKCHTDAYRAARSLRNLRMRKRHEEQES